MIKRHVKHDVYYLSGLLVAVLLTGSVCNDWMINTRLANAEIEINRDKVLVLGEVNRKNAELEKSYEQLIDSIGEEGKPVVVKIVNDGSAKSKAMIRAKERFGAEHLAAFEQLMNHESGYNPSAQNPKSSAFGMFQFMDFTWKSYNCQKTEEVDMQITCGLNYIEARYKNPTEAWRHWLARVPINGKDHGHWY